MILRFWVEYRDEYGDRYMRPATTQDLAALGLSSCQCGHEETVDEERAGEEIHAILGEMSASE
jgi:hypothetical protein